MLDREKADEHAANGNRERSAAPSPNAPAVARLLSLQRSAGNHAVTALVRAHAIQRTDAGATAPVAAPAETPAAGTAPAADAGTTAPASDPAVDALSLQPKAKGVANKLKAKYPSISFTSGLRDDVSEQANAMAGNVVSNRQWITETYTDKTLAKKLQDWVDANPKATTKEDIAKGLTETMEKWTAKEKGRLSAHFTGEAFDIQPQDDKQAEIKSDADTFAKAEGGKFLEKEGGLVRWHVQVRE